MRKSIKVFFNTVMLKLIIPGDQPMFSRGERIVSERTCHLIKRRNLLFRKERMDWNSYQLQS